MKELKFKAEIEIIKPNGKIIDANGVLQLDYDVIPDDTEFEFLEDLNEYFKLVDVDVEDEFLKNIVITKFNNGDRELRETRKGYYVVIELTKADLKRYSQRRSKRESYLAVYLTDEEKEKVNRYAQEQGVSASTLIRLFLKEKGIL